MNELIVFLIWILLIATLQIIIALFGVYIILRIENKLLKVRIK